MTPVAIRILPPEVASRIAAGEVVERPASIVKELVENALDAGATRVSVEANEGGVALIRVTDDGCGIVPDELPLAFSRHATSKLPAGADLDAIATLGFRGEALPSVAAVAEVEAVSRQHDSPTAGRVRISYGEFREQGAAGAAPGTSISVRNLFREQPARLKFLRSAGSEASQIASIVSHYALAYPEVAFTLRLDAKDSFSTTGSGSRREAAAGVYGRDVGASMIDVHELDDSHSLEALVAAPHVTRANRSYVTIFINRRWVRSRSLAYAVEEAYSGMLQTGRFPIAIVDLRLPPEEVDVNVHPAKAEVRLRNERQVFTLVQRPIRAALSGLSPVGAEAAAAWPRAPLTLSPPNYQFSTASALSRPEAGAPLQSDLIPRRGFEPEATQEALPAAMPILRPLGQAGTTYIIAEGPAGLYLVDQHAAHERVMYERYLRELSASAQVAQPLLAPLALELTPAQASLVSSFSDALEAHGFGVPGPGNPDDAQLDSPVESRRLGGIRTHPETLLKLPKPLARTIPPWSRTRRAWPSPAR